MALDLIENIMIYQKINNYKDLIVWQKSLDLSVKVYAIAKALPPDESANLISQMKRASVSISSNIAEGYSKGGKKYYRCFMKIAFGSAAELESQLLLCEKLGMINDGKLFKETKELVVEVLKMLTVMIKNVS